MLARWLLAAALLLCVPACQEPAPPPVPAVAPPAPEPVQERQAFPEAPLAPPSVPAEAPKPMEPPVALGDLAEMKKRGTLRVLLDGAEEGFLPRQGMPREQDRLMLERFARRHGLKAEFLVVERFDRLLPLLLEGRGDLIAASLTVTKEREKQLAFTRPVAVVSEVVVGRRGAPDLPKRPEDLAGRTVHVRESSAFAETLRALAEKRAPGLTVQAVPESLDPETLAYDVSRGERPLTVIDSHLLAGVEAYNPDVQRLFPIAEGRQIAWGVRPESAALKAALDGFISEQALTEYTAERFTGDLDGIRKRGALRVLTRNNPVTYFLHRGEPHGFDYQLARAAAEALGVRLEMVVAPSRDQLIPWLREGRGDVIAASFTITPEREAQVAFSTPYLYVDEVLVQPSASGAKLTSPADLKGRAVHVRGSSSYHAALLALRETHGPFEIVLEPEDQETEVLVDRVGRGELPLTVADSHLLGAERMYRDDVEAAFPLAQGRAIAFAVRQESGKLRAFLDGFVKKTYRGTHYNMWRKRYFENKRQISEAKEEGLFVSGRISPYDDLIQRYSSRYGMDWRLMSAQAYQESRFDPKAKSWVGALGLFQVMPGTGKSLGFLKLEDPEQGTHAGVMYMSRLIGQLEPELPFKHRLRFALAAYNAGLGHVLDARRLAREQGWNPDKWFGHVEKAMLLLEKPQYYRRARHGYCRGSEPVKYVSEIQTRYGQYVEALPH
jgi:membrane-bound lytic murein transglycosylase F